MRLGDEPKPEVPKFFPVPGWAVRLQWRDGAKLVDVSWGAKMLLGVLAYYQGKNATAWPSLAQLMSDTGASQRTVSRWIRELSDASALEVLRTGRSSTYRLVRPPPIRQDRQVRHANTGGSDTPVLADQGCQEWPIRDASSGGSDLPGMASPIEETKEETKEETPPTPSGPSQDGAGAPPPLELVRENLDDPAVRKRVAARNARERRERTEPARLEEDRLARASRLAMRRAVESQGGIYDAPDHAQHLKVARMVSGWCERRSAELQATLDDWAMHWVGVAEHHAASVWVLYVTSRVAGKTWGRRGGGPRKTDVLPPRAGEGFDDGDLPSPVPRKRHA